MKLRRITEINVMWKGRKQTLKECTEDLIIFLERLKKFDSRLGVWYERAYSRKEGMKNKVRLEYEFIKNHFYESDKYEENNFPEFSFLTGFWNGAATEPLSYGIQFSLGGDGRVGNDICTLTFPYEGDVYEHYRIRENWEKLLELFIDHWQPDKYRDFEDNLIEL